MAPVPPLPPVSKPAMVRNQLEEKIGRYKSMDRSQSEEGTAPSETTRVLGTNLEEVSLNAMTDYLLGQGHDGTKPLVITKELAGELNKVAAEAMEKHLKGTTHVSVGNGGDAKPLTDGERYDALDAARNANGRMLGLLSKADEAGKGLGSIEKQGKPKAVDEPPMTVLGVLERPLSNIAAEVKGLIRKLER